jgi:peptidase E
MNAKRPVYLLAGGRSGRRESPDPLIQTIIKEGGKTSPAIAYVGAASRDDKGFFRMIADMFMKAGAGRVEQALTVSSRVNLDKTRDILTSADLVFISGGDVEAGMKILQDRKMTGFLSRLFEEGKLFFGLSAGSIMLAEEWVLWRDPDDDSTAGLFPCLGFAPVICDTHAEADDWEELKAALALEKDGATGCGIATGTGLKVYPDGKVEALGGPVYRYIRRGIKVERLSDLLPASTQ